MKTLFVEKEVVFYIEIIGDPIFDVYEDEGKIQDEGNEFEVKGVDNWRGDLLLQKILVKGNYLELHNSRVKLWFQLGFDKRWPNKCFHTSS